MAVYNTKMGPRIKVRERQQSVLWGTQYNLIVPWGDGQKVWSCGKCVTDYTAAVKKGVGVLEFTITSYHVLGSGSTVGNGNEPEWKWNEYANTNGLAFYYNSPPTPVGSMSGCAKHGWDEGHHPPPPPPPITTTHTTLHEEEQLRVVVVNSSSSPPFPSIAPGRPSRRNSLLRQSPFRTTRGGAATTNNLRSAARLWNPTNSTPRVTPNSSPTTPTSTSARTRPRRPSTPPPPPVPLDITGAPVDHSLGLGDDPLLPDPDQDQRQKRPNISHRASLQFDRIAGAEQTISLPKRVSPIPPSPAEAQPPPTVAGPSKPKPPPVSAASPSRRLRSRGQSISKVLAPLGLSFERSSDKNNPKGKGKEKEVITMASPDHNNDDRFSPDLERGATPGGLPNNRHSTASQISGIGSAISSDDSSIMGDPDQQPDNGEEWGPQHPCYPHLNPYVPLDSPEYAKTRIIRIRRDWLLEGDLAPTFSNLYPDILDPAGLGEQEFRRIIEKLNGELVLAFSPYHWRNILDGVLGLATGWLWDDFGFTGIKARLKGVEKWIEEWNDETARSFGGDEQSGVIPPRIVPLKTTGYMTLDIQIPDPEIAPVSEPTSPGLGPGGDSGGDSGGAGPSSPIPV
ncbi:Golgin subfamily A member 7/ERF4 family-domain-containing protein [Podospora fimiseda]|uniref:Ras modification protein ERF4 n=1 Tax=Podospora fimiseda TaxID=252190 RepID=A0AAN7BHZ6_9PEZI|nr:Golgin subfamily A member 7/ERF4 family-domain-containing protein [Podospora fimiseda]